MRRSIAPVVVKYKSLRGCIGSLQMYVLVRFLLAVTQLTTNSKLANLSL